MFVDNKLTFEKQVAECVKKANAFLASIKRKTKFMNKDVLLTIHKSLVSFFGVLWSYIEPSPDQTRQKA